MAAAMASLQRSGGGTAVTWGRYLLGGRWERRCFFSHTNMPPTTPAPLLLLPPSPTSSSLLAPPELRLQLVLPGMLPFGAGSMNLMAVPKKKVSPYKKGLRNGPKALKPVPVIVRCRSCGRVKLPHFYCCSGDRGSSGKSESTS